MLVTQSGEAVWTQQSKLVLIISLCLMLRPLTLVKGKSSCRCREPLWCPVCRILLCYCLRILAYTVRVTLILLRVNRFLSTELVTGFLSKCVIFLIFSTNTYDWLKFDSMSNYYWHFLELIITEMIVDFVLEFPLCLHVIIQSIIVDFL